MEQQYAYYRLEDGRLWSIAEARFVDDAPADACCAVPVAEDGSRGEQAVRECLLYFGWPLGELATDDDLAKEAREKRNQLIAETDFMAMPDYPLDEERKTAVLAYRQALRDVPEQEGFPRQIDWPVKP